MTEKNVNVFQVEALQGLVDPFDDVLTGQTSLVDNITTPKHFGRNDELRTINTESLQNLSHRYLCFTSSIHFGIIKKVATSVEGGFAAFIKVVVLNLTSSSDPRTGRKTKVISKHKREERK